MSYYDEHGYLILLQEIMQRGEDRPNRTGTPTRATFGAQMRFDLQWGFPLLTTKKIHTRAVVHELLWFLRGDTNTRYLNENGVTIWDEWADEQGNLGPIYGHQWRSWPDHDEGEIDQITQLVDDLKRDPFSRRHIVTAWNPADIPRMALAPCHCLFQFYVHQRTGRLSCQLYQRSADMFLGVPFNIASYALLTHMIAQQVGLEPGEFVWTGGDCHIYHNHFEQVRTQIARAPFMPPQLALMPKPSLFAYEYEDIIFRGYEYHPALPGKVAV